MSVVSFRFLVSFFIFWDTAQDEGLRVDVRCWQSSFR